MRRHFFVKMIVLSTRLSCASTPVTRTVAVLPSAEIVRVTVCTSSPLVIAYLIVLPLTCRAFD